ncbi:hypothetical protein [Rhizobium sp. 2MFCol3.1]|uniref:hypothetical protein n=1 Tax=Rhizobium sp. 2MFCol3.1 TaxID=1246459 RepID=UPI0012DF93FE|nr:hypothetical protein [Rhizobium sp. 2MFCol3.1]
MGKQLKIVDPVDEGFEEILHRRCPDSFSAAGTASAQFTFKLPLSLINVGSADETARRRHSLLRKSHRSRAFLLLGPAGRWVDIRARRLLFIA